MGNFGYTTIGTDYPNYASVAGSFFDCVFTLGSTQIFTSVSVYLNQPSATGTFYMYITDVDKLVLRYTSEGSLAAGEGWQTLNLTSSITLNAGTYRIGFMSTVVPYIYYNNSGSSQQDYWNGASYTYPPTTTIPFSATNYFVFSIYATYEESNATYFGYNVIGDNHYNAGARVKEGSKFTLAQNTTVTSMSYYCGAVSGTSYIKFGIYDLSLALIGYTEEITVTTTVGWWTANCNISLVAGDYYLVAAGSQVIEGYYTTGDTNQYIGQVVTYANEFANPFGGVSTGPYKFSIYATLSSDIEKYCLLNCMGY